MAAGGTDQEDLSRPLGAAERVFHFYNEAHPCTFSIALLLDADVELARLQAAADEIATAHPLLRARVQAGPAGAPNAHWAPAAMSVDVTEASAAELDRVLAEEQVRLFDAANGPLWRAVLAHVQERTGVGTLDAIVLSFDHRLLDGRGALVVAGDLLTALDGETVTPRPVPAAQEHIAVTAQVPEPAAQPSARIDPRMAEPAAIRPFDASVPSVQVRVLPEDVTTRVVRAAREHGVSVQAALAASTAAALGRRGRRFVRVIHPVDLRRPLGWPLEDVALRLMLPPARTGAEPAAGGDWWPEARAIHGDLQTQITPAAALERLLTLESVAPSDSDAATEGMLAISGMDAMITNLGVVDALPGGRVHCVGIIGPTMTFQVVGEIVLGVITYGGQLHASLTTREPVEGLLDDVLDSLRAHAYRAATS